MLTVRFPTGVAIQYNTAFFLKRWSDRWQLYTDDPAKGGSWIASIQLSAGAVIEAQGACHVENATDNRSRERALQIVLEDVRWYATAFPSALRQLKAALREFDATRGRWRA